MIYVSIGMPSAFSDWCEAVIAEFVRRKSGEVQTVAANTLEDMATNIIKTGAPQIVVCSRMPNYRLAKALADAKTRFLFVLDDPRTTIAFLMAERGLDLLAAIQAVANSYACLTRCAKLSNALVLDATQYTHDPLALIRSIGGHFDFPTDEAALTEISASVHAKGLKIDRPPPDTWWNGLDKSAKALIDGATKAYVEYFSTGKLGLITWHRDLFLNGDTHKHLTQAIDLTGRTRFLFYGPYINLPQGEWTAHVVFGCSKEAAGIGLIIDVNAGTQLSQTRLQPNSGGIFEVTLRFAIEESNGSPVEIRIHNERAVLEGLLSLSHVTLTPENEPRVVQSPELSAELGLEVS